MASWPALIPAVLICALTAIASFGLAQEPTTVRGLDQNLAYATAGARVTAQGAILDGGHRSAATLNLATTLRRRLVISLTTTVLTRTANAVPLRIGIWSPWTRSGYFVIFGPPPDDGLAIETVRDGAIGPTLTGGTVAAQSLGTYVTDRPYRLVFDLDRDLGTIAVALTGPKVAQAASQLTRAEQPELFRNVQVSVTATTQGGEGTARTALSDVAVSVPPEPPAPAHAGLTIQVATALLLALCLVCVATALWRRRGNLYVSTLASAGHITPFALTASVLYAAANIALFPLGGHPFDFLNETFYAYVAHTYGMANLYFRPEITSLPQIWNGVPWVEASFPYGPVMAYVFGAAGWALSLLPPGGAAFIAGAGSYGYAIKALDTAVGLADGALLYAVLASIGVARRWRRIALLMWLFNPALWFSVSIWGQTHVISIFLMLAAILFALRRRPVWAWVALIAACGTRPQVLIFGLLFSVVLLRSFSWRENARALSWSAMICFLAYGPVTLVTSPSLPLDILRYNFQIQELGGNQTLLTTVSQDAYSVWPLVTYLVGGTSGIARAFTPSATHLVGPLTYQAVSQVATASVLLLSVVLLLRLEPNAIRKGAFLPAVALGTASALMLLTGIVATHFVLALPLLLLALPWMDRVAYIYVAVIWTFSTFVPMYGDMAIAMLGRGYRLLGPEHNEVTNLVMNTYASDRFITLAIAANICAVIWLGSAALRLRTGSKLQEVAA